METLRETAGDGSRVKKESIVCFRFSVLPTTTTDKMPTNANAQSDGLTDRQTGRLQAHTRLTRLMYG